ncbi:MAG: YCF48-related protein [Patescibacteria group bacterium]|nr:YCF48-related protein [Patescibacteria group bacterium]
MKFFKTVVLFLSIFILPLLLSGCLGASSQKQETPPDGGVFRSSDKGATWRQSVLISSVSGRPGNFAYADVVDWQMDPSDSNAIYYTARGQGLLYTYDTGNSWQRSVALGKIKISDITVDPNDKCTIYIGTANRVLKTEDCARTWRQMYFDSDTKVKVRTVAIDYFDSDNIYVGLSRGEIIKSLDKGETWQTIARLKADINRFIIDPNDNRVMYLHANKIALRKSLDSGVTWESFNEPLKDNELGLGLNRMLLFSGEPEKMYLSTGLGIIYTIDNGETWSKIKIIPDEKKAGILDIAVNPQNNKEIYYTTKTTFFRSNDNGENWQTIKLPTTRKGSKLTINPNKPNIIYLAAGR